MIFMDAAKGQYENWLPDVKRLLKKGGILITDNILQDGDMLKARSAVRRRDRTIHKRMQDYIFELTHDKELDTILLNTGDGMAVSGKKD
jgi:predicted O-methyltransferase YrrM